MEQRLLMLQFMEEHPDLAQNRISGLDAKKQTMILWDELANRLNSTRNGVTKSTDKWIKSWRDWRVDVKGKVAKLKNYQRGTGGGGPSSAPLQEIEKRLIALIDKEAVEGHLNIIDPAEPKNGTESLRSILTQENQLPSQPLPVVQQFPFLLSSTIHSQENTLASSQSFVVQSTPLSVNPHSNIQLCREKNTLSSYCSSNMSSPSSIHSHSSTRSKQSDIILLFSSSTSSEPKIFPQINKREVKKQRLANIDVQILNEMKAQTITLQKLSDTITDMASSIKCLVNANLVLNTNIEDEEMIDRNVEYLEEF